MKIADCKDPASARRGAAFSTIELLVVIGVLATVVALCFPAYLLVRGKAEQNKCISHLRLVGTHIHIYAADHANTLPPGHDGNTGKVWTNFVKEYVQGFIPGQGGTTKADEFFYCPTTKPQAAEDTFKRNRQSWGTDYGANVNILLNTTKEQSQRSLKLIALSSPKILLWDGRGLSGFSAPQNHYARHFEKINYLFHDNHIEVHSEVPTDKVLWVP